MKKFYFQMLNNYTNRGQNIEQSIRYALTTQIAKADNLPHDKGADCLHYQIKSARATICKGTDIETYLATDAATAYIYGTQDDNAYVMTKAEYIAFCKAFAQVDRDSHANGGHTKMRLPKETKAVLAYLANAVR